MARQSLHYKKSIIGWAGGVSRKASVLSRLVKRSPHIILIPLALFCAITALGVYGVIEATSETVQQQREAARVDAEGANQALQRAFQRAATPLFQIAELVRLIPDKQALEKQWDISAPTWMLGADPGTQFISLSPFGVTQFIYPPQAPTAAALLGINWLAIAAARPSILAAIKNPGLRFNGPIIKDGTLACTIQQPIQLENATATETWGHPFNASLCPPGVCYNEATKTKWWGLVGVNLDVRGMLGAGGPLSALLTKGYQYQLWQAAVWKNSVEQLPVTGVTLDQPKDAVKVKISVFDITWELHVWKDSWAPAWMMPLIAAVVIGAFIVSALLFSTLSSWEEHRALLHSLLPKETIARMRNEAKWAADEQDDVLKTIRLETPAELMLRIIEECITGRSPDLPLLLSVRDALHRSADVYRPNEQQMRERMEEIAGLDEEVQKALQAQLLGTRAIGNEVNITVRPLMLESKDSTWECDASSTGSALFKSFRKSVDLSQDDASPLNSREIIKLRVDGTEAGVSSPLSQVVRGQLDLSARAYMQFLASYAAGCASFMTSSGLSQEVGTVLSRWMLQAPHVAGLLKDATKKQAPDGSGIIVSCRPAAAEVTKPVPDQVAVVMKPILTQLERVLVSAGEWSFDAYALDEASHGRPLSCLGFWLLHSTGIKTWARMNTKRLTRFLERVEEGYANNPYHNRRHAADVLQSVHVLMHKAGLVPGFADQLTLLGCYLAAIVHDFEHVGRTNDFLVNSSDDLAVRYNDRSPMENHHLAAAWALLKAKDCNILSGLSRAEVAKLRKLVIDLVLSTDMKQHFAIVGQFETMARQKVDYTVDRESAEVSSARSDRKSKYASVNETEPKPVNDQDQLLSLQMMLKCADLGHIAAPLEVHLRWVSALEAEFFLQGDEEKALGLPISPLCDRNKEGVTKSQIGFFDFVVLPLFKTFSQRFTGASPMMQSVQNNLAHWRTPQRGSMVS